MGFVRRIGVAWFVTLGVVVLGFAVLVLILNSTVYSAPGFVRTYLDALARHDAETALEVAGTAAVNAGDADDVLLSRPAMGDLTDIEVVEDQVDAAGVHHVVVEYVAGGLPGRTEFTVRRDGTLFGVFNDWAFARSPIAILQLTVQHERMFTANGIELVGEQDVAQPYLVFAPSAIRLSHDSEFYHADPKTVLVSEPGGAVEAAVNIQATKAFVANVQAQINAYLDECTTQRVLLPAGCPFGETIVNRIVTEPTWSMSEYPEIRLVPDGRIATWRVERTPAAAHLVVDVQSIFDGTITTFDEDVPFTVSYEVTVLPDGDPLIRAIYE